MDQTFTILDSYNTYDLRLNKHDGNIHDGNDGRNGDATLLHRN